MRLRNSQGARKATPNRLRKKTSSNGCRVSAAGRIIAVMTEKKTPATAIHSPPRRGAGMDSK